MFKIVRLVATGLLISAIGAVARADEPQKTRIGVP
jgi:hypothetical protein